MEVLVNEKREMHESRKFYDGLYLLYKIVVALDRVWDNVIKKLNNERLAQKFLKIF